MLSAGAEPRGTLHTQPRGPARLPPCNPVPGTRQLPWALQPGPWQRLACPPSARARLPQRRLVTLLLQVSAVQTRDTEESQGSRLFFLCPPRSTEPQVPTVPPRPIRGGSLAPFWGGACFVYLHPGSCELGLSAQCRRPLGLALDLIAFLSPKSRAAGWGAGQRGRGAGADGMSTSLAEPRR